MATNDDSESRAFPDDMEQVDITDYKQLLPNEYNNLLPLAEISSEHRDLLRTNIPSAEDDEGDEYEEHYTDEGDVKISDTDEVEPSPKRSPSIKPFRLFPEVCAIAVKEKTSERRKYENYLKLQSADASSIENNLKRLWFKKGWKVATALVAPIIKQGVMIDREFPLAASCFVYKSPDIKNDLYSVTLCQTCISSNRNSFFKMQLLKEDDHETYYVFRNFGRIGTRIGDIFNEPFHSLDEAIAEFEKDFEHLTGNRWRERHFFVPKQNHMTLVEMDYTEFETLICDADGRLIPAGSQSSLPEQIKEILLKVFDSKNIRKVLDSYNFDMERMPMGKLSALQVSRASGLLNQAVALMERIGPGSTSFNADEFEKQVTDLSNKFYSTLPQSFGYSTPPIMLSRKGQIDKMRGMIDALLDIQFVCNILNDANQDARMKGLDPIDLQYNRLMMTMDVVPPDHSDYELVHRYITHGFEATHAYRGFELLDLIRLERLGEQAKFRRHYGNRKLLWHGSPVQNFPGILMQGLKIAPPDALQTGHAYGRGVYFADCFAKSANYCRADQEEIGFLLLCDVALGVMKDFGGITGPSSNSPQTQSTRVVGETFPDPVDDHHHSDGYVIPLGKSISNSANDRRVHAGHRFYNEYIVYDTDQICLKYLCRVKFLYNNRWLPTSRITASVPVVVPPSL